MCYVIIYITEFISWTETTRCAYYFRFVEKGNLEVLLFTLQSKMRANNQKPYTPREGKMIADINRAWEQLEKSEHERELALKEELIRFVVTKFNVNTS